jgi:Platelet-activating factor acetylhydrolase, isoform II
MSSSSESEALPTPSGRYHVGRTSYDWIDAQRAEIYSSDPQDRRELFVWVWYPAAPDADAAPAAYLPDPWAPTGQFLGLDATGLQSHAAADAAMATDQATFPALVMSPSGFPPLLLAAIGEELASHGYVVVGVNHTYETAVTVFTDGRIIPINPDAIAGALGPQTGPYQEGSGSGRRSAGTRPPTSPRSATGSGGSPPTRMDPWPAVSTWIASAHSGTRSAAMPRWNGVATTRAASRPRTWTGRCGPKSGGSG